MRGVHIGEEATGGDPDSIEREETSPDQKPCLPSNVGRTHFLIPTV